MTSFGCVPLASVWPCARWVDAMTSPSSSARQTPDRAASWPDRDVEEPGELSRAEPLLDLLLEAPDEQHLAEELAQQVLRDTPLLLHLGQVGFEFMLRLVSLVAQWREIVGALPGNWADARLRLTVDDEQRAARAAAVLAPLNPGRRGNGLRFHSARSGAGPAPALVERLLARLDETISGSIELVARTRLPHSRSYPPTLAGAWDASIAELPPDWSDLYAEVELVSTDWLERAALLMAPVNPARYGEAPGFRFRVARRFGYGAAPEMTRRCLERVDDEHIRGELRILRVLSETDPVATQGPVWYLDGRSV